MVVGVDTKKEAALIRYKYNQCLFTPNNIGRWYGESEEEEEAARQERTFPRPPL